MHFLKMDPQVEETVCRVVTCPQYHKCRIRRLWGHHTRIHSHYHIITFVTLVMEDKLFDVRWWREDADYHILSQIISTERWGNMRRSSLARMRWKTWWLCPGMALSKYDVQENRSGTQTNMVKSNFKTRKH